MPRHSPDVARRRGAHAIVRWAECLDGAELFSDGVRDAFDPRARVATVRRLVAR